MTTVRKTLDKAQQHYKKDFDARVRLPKDLVNIGDKIFIQKDYIPEGEPHHKLAPKVDGLFPVIQVSDKTCVIKYADNTNEEVTLDRIVLAPKPAIGTKTDEKQTDPQANENVARTDSQPKATTRSSTDEARDAADEGSEYVIDRIEGHEKQPNGLYSYRIRWYNFESDDETWEPCAHLPRSHVLCHHRKNKFPPPADLKDARVG